MFGFNDMKGYLVYDRNDYDANVKTYKGTRIFKDTETGNTDLYNSKRCWMDNFK